MNRRELLSKSSKALLASYLLSTSRDSHAQTETPLTSAEKAMDTKRQALIAKLTASKPYAVVVNMDYDNSISIVSDPKQDIHKFKTITSLTMDQLADALHEAEYLHKNHVPYFVKFATEGKVAAWDSTTKKRIPDSSQLPASWGNPPRIHSNGYFLSVRKTGKDSLVRIGNAYPTKPHAILDKSLKDKSLKDLGELLNHLKANFPNEKLTLVPSAAHAPFASSLPMLGVEMTTPILIQKLTALWTDAGFWKNGSYIEGGDYMGLVGWWVTVHYKGNPLEHPKDAGKELVKPRYLRVPVGYLRVGTMSAPSPQLNGQAKYPEGVPIPFAKGAQIHPDGYTGDYDLHDVYFAAQDSQHMRRPVISTDRTLVSRPSFDSKTTEKEFDSISRMLNWSINRERNLSTAPSDESRGDKRDGYSNMVQHGSQNLYYAYIMELENKITAGLTSAHAEELEKSLLSWDTGGVLFFSPDNIFHIFDAERLESSVSGSNAEAIKKAAEDKMVDLLRSYHRIHNLHKCRTTNDFKIWSTNGLANRIKTKTKP